MKRISHILKKLYEIIKQPMLRILPGQLAYFLILSIFPILILMGVIASMFSLSIDSILDMMQKALPPEVVDLLGQYVQGKGFDSNVGIFMIMGFLIASNGAHSIVLASNTLYEFPHADYIKRRIKSIFIIFLLIFIFIFSLIVLAFGNNIVKLIFDILNMPKVASTVYLIFKYLKWPITMFIIFFSIKIIYTIAPDNKILSKDTTKGALFTTFGWAIATAIYSYYVSHFTNYDIFYGSLSNIVIMMIWIYVISYILVIGIAINVQDYKSKEG